jgi:D-sedoheptulose 7-phosphate isomerase
MLNAAMSALRVEIRAQLRESCRVKESFSEELVRRIEQFAVVSAQALAAGKKLVFFGNGGSAADAQHLAAELVVRLAADRPGLPAVALTTNSSILTAVANDYGYENVFARQIESLVNQGDVLIAISTSGRSRNIIAGVEAGARREAFRVGLTGESGGELAGKVDLLLNVPSTDVQRIQEAHITIGHVACSLIEQLRFGRPAG